MHILIHVLSENCFPYWFRVLTLFEKIRPTPTLWNLFIPVFIFKFAFFFKGSFFIYNFVYLFIFGCPVSLLLLKLFSSCGEQGLLSSLGMQALHCGASLVAGHKLQQLRALRLGSVAHGLSCSEVRGLLPGRGSSPRLLHCQVDSSHWATREALHLLLFIYIFDCTRSSL